MTQGTGLILAAPSTGSGKTTITLGLLRAYRRRGLAVAPAKAGPDYIDPAFHAKASGRVCFNLDGWAMRPERLAGLIGEAAHQADFILAEGVMGLFDGANVADGPDGSTADLAALTGWPVILVLDVSRMGASAGAVLKGFASYRSDVRLAGVILNRVSGEGHQAMVERACRKACPDMAILGALPRIEALSLPSRHLGLVQAAEHPDLESAIERAADLMERYVDLDGLAALAQGTGLRGCFEAPLPVLGQRIAIAKDAAFAFAYPAILEGWRRLGAELSFFSPLAGEGPSKAADAVYLPGGYPQLNGPVLSQAQGFLQGMKAAAARDAWIYGECGGFMALGQAIVDADGKSYAMAGLLPLVTSFQKRRLHLGYRKIRGLADTPFGAAGATFRGHEFHYATIQSQEEGANAFDAWDAKDDRLLPMGLIRNRVFGSFLHLIGN
ncbi:MAG: cobyrinate a,c-diamide synthase [Alphaproteobacteria bacterium]|nr:cobyrinate a,c-diamide synthase [Alphaproteobacteria bacterium]